MYAPVCLRIEVPRAGHANVCVHVGTCVCIGGICEHAHTLVCISVCTHLHVFWMHCELRWVCMLSYLFVDNVFVFKKSTSAYLSVRAHLWRDRAREASPLPKSLCGVPVGFTQAGLCPRSS